MSNLPPKRRKSQHGGVNVGKAIITKLAKPCDYKIHIINKKVSRLMAQLTTCYKY